MSDICTQERFLKTVSQHEMTIVRDEGLHRHLRFARPGNPDSSFTIVTWPWRLCYTGDMGTYVFCRLEDMFEFFRKPPATDGQFHFDRGYWAEKVLAADRHGGIREFSETKFRAALLDLLGGTPTPEIAERIAEEILPHGNDSKDAAFEAAANFEVDGKHPFEDIWHGYSAEDYTYRFTFCCYALAWGIQQYDKARSELARP